MNLEESILAQNGRPLPQAPSLQKEESVPNTDSLCVKISKQLGAILCLIIMVIDWVVYAEIIQSFDSGSFNHLFFLRYCGACGFMLAIIPWYFTHSQSMKSIENSRLELAQAKSIDIKQNHLEQSLLGASYRSLPNNSQSASSSSASSQSEIIATDPEEEIHRYNMCQSMRYISRGIIFVGTCSFFAGYTWYNSLDYTFVAANNTVYQSQCVFVLLFSSLVLKTKITFVKVFAMLLAVGGVAMVSFGTTNESQTDVEPTWFGYILCISSTILCAMQTVSTKYFGDKYFRKGLELSDNFFLMFGMGLFIFLCFWPGFIFLHFTGLEAFALPKTYNEIITVVLPIWLDTVYTGSFMAGITLGGPILMSLGALSVIPCSFMTDVWLHGLEVTPLAVCGSILIFVSFVVIEIPMDKVFTCCFKQRKEVQKSDK